MLIDWWFTCSSLDIRLSEVIGWSVTRSGCETFHSAFGAEYG